MSWEGWLMLLLGASIVVLSPTGSTWPERIVSAMLGAVCVCLSVGFWSPELIAAIRDYLAMFKG